MRFENFVGGTYQSWSPNANAERAINVYPEIVESKGGKVRVTFNQTPGLQTHCTLPKSPIRALWAGEDVLFAVAGDTFYQILANGTFSARGAVGDDATHTPAQISSNGNQLMIVSAGYVWIDQGAGPVQPTMLNGQGAVNTSGTTVTWVSGDKFEASLAAPGNTFAIGAATYTVASVTNDTTLVLTTTAGTQTNQPYTARNLVTARTGCFLDSYFIVAPPDSKLFYFSDSYNGFIWNPLEVSVKEGYPDNIAALYADHEELWIFGSHASTEVWRNEGDRDTAGGFRRDPGGFIHGTTIAPWSVVSMAGGLHYLGGDTRGRVVAYRAQGFQPVRVSNHGVEAIWNTYTTVRDAYAFTYTELGHQFWVINFITANATWVYDLATELWHERAFWNGTSLEKWRGRCHAFAFGPVVSPNFTGSHFVGDHTSGKIYKMSQDLLTDDGVAIQRIRQAPYAGNEESKVFHHQFRLELEITGPPTGTPPALSPSVELDWSDDDGKTWSPKVRRAPQAVTRTRASVPWNRLGHAYPRIYRTTIAGPWRVAITDAFLSVSPGSN